MDQGCGQYHQVLLYLLLRMDHKVFCSWSSGFIVIVYEIKSISSWLVFLNVLNSLIICSALQPHRKKASILSLVLMMDGGIDERRDGWL